MPPIVKLIALLFVVTYMLQLGVTAPEGGLLGAMRKRRGELARGLLLLLVVSPVATYAVARAFGLQGPANTSLVLLSVVGLAPLTPKRAHAAKGDVHFALILTLVIAVLAIFTAVPIARVLLSYERPLDLSEGTLLMKLLLVQGLPLAIGLVLRRRLTPAQNSKLATILGVAGVVLLLAVFAIIVAPRLDALLAIGWAGVLAALVSSAILAGLAWVGGGPTPEGRRTLSTAVNMPNFGLALVIAYDAGGPPALSVAILGVFFLRAIGDFVLSALLGRSARRAGPPPSAHGPRPAVT